MIAFIIRIVLALVATGFNVYLFTSGHWGWGITFIFLTALIIVSFFLLQVCNMLANNGI